MAIPNDPITREEQYLASMAGQEVDLPQPITRVEKYLAKASGMDVETPDPITREEKYLDAIAEGGGGSSVTVEPLTVTENGITTAPSGKAYSPVTTNVPNSYGASDEGKVVNNGALVAQTAHAPVTANGTIDTTLNNSVTVNVPNPNYVETISGTLGNPWGGKFAAIRDAVEAGDATAVMTFYGFDSLGEIVEIDNVKYFVFCGTSPNIQILQQNNFTLFRSYYDYVSGALILDEDDPVALIGTNTSSIRWELSWLSASADATVTIIHHPLPSNG